MRLEVVYLGSCSGGEGGGPSKLRLPKDGGGGLPKDVTDRRPNVGEGEGRMLRGCPAGSLVTPVEEKEQKKAPPTGRIGGQQPSVCAGPLQLHRGDGDAFQKLMARLLALKQL